MPPRDTRLTTGRLILRSWRDDDLDDLAAMGRDEDVMRYFPGPLSREQSRTLLDRLMAREKETGLTFWATIRREDRSFLGFVGIAHVPFEAHFTPAVEVGWRLARHAWGHGYATEAARASLIHGFETCGFEEIVALTVPANKRSRAVMERLGMTRSPADDFDNPMIEPGHALSRHVLYRLNKTTWQARTAAAP